MAGGSARLARHRCGSGGRCPRRSTTGTSSSPPQQFATQLLEVSVRASATPPRPCNATSEAEPRSTAESPPPLTTASKPTPTSLHQARRARRFVSRAPICRDPTSALHERPAPPPLQQQPRDPRAGVVFIPAPRLGFSRLAAAARTMRLIFRASPETRSPAERRSRPRDRCGLQPVAAVAPSRRAMPRASLLRTPAAGGLKLIPPCGFITRPCYFGYTCAIGGSCGVMRRCLPPITLRLWLGDGTLHAAHSTQRAEANVRSHVIV